MEITLLDYEMEFAAAVGLRRQLHAMRAGKPEAFGASLDKRWGNHIEGACGEMAVAKALELYWNGSFNTYKTGGDVLGFQVRTRSKSDYDLIVRKNDRDDDVFILAIGIAPKFEIVGYIKGANAKQETWSKTHGDRPAAYFVPQASLKSIEFLRAAIHQGIYQTAKERIK